MTTLAELIATHASDLGDNYPAIAARLNAPTTIDNPRAGETDETTAPVTITLKALLALGPKAVLLKGGHLPGDEVVDLLATGVRIEIFRDRRIATRHTHGTGCTLASAVAAGLAQGLSLRDSVIRARAYVRAAIASAPGFGAGHGPLNHAVTCDPGVLR
jgi:hydroxymethylpyrimidine/phosphomethylpyrimidine kinase